jgi:hypothetical protein
MSMTKNPHTDPDRAAIWTMLMPRDFEAFAAQDWSMVANDFDDTRFLGIHAHFSDDRNIWNAAFPSVAAYRDDWLRQAEEAAKLSYASPLPAQLLQAVTLDRIDINGNVALCHKIFDGTIRLADGGEDKVNWQTHYYVRKDHAAWKITGFTGYMKYK